MALTVRFFAVAREAVGVAELRLPAGPVSEVCSAVVSAVEPSRQERVARVLAGCTLLSEGVRFRADDGALLADGAVVDVLPPFAGG